MESLYTLSPAEMRNLRNTRRLVQSRRRVTPRLAKRIADILKLVKSRGEIEVYPDARDKITRLASEPESKELITSFKEEVFKRIEKAKKEKRKLNILFIVGSGASRPFPSNIPTVNEMLDYLIDRLPPTEIPFASKMKDWATLEGVNIEDIITAGYLSTLLVSKPIVNRLIGEIIYRESEKRVAKLREREYVFSFQDLVNRVFSMVSGMMAKAESNIVHDSIAGLMKDFQEDELLKFSVATTNYDVCIEKACVKNELRYRYLGIGNERGTPIIKIHGSINWFYCEGCQSVITYSIRELETFKKIYPTSGSCQECGTSTSLFMVPPIAYKYVMFPPLIDIWQATMNTIEKADIIIVIGYSFSLADDYIFKMIVSGVKKRGSILVMLDRSFTSISNLQEKLSPYHLKLPYPINGDAIKTTPEIINAIKEARKKATEEKGTKTTGRSSEKRSKSQ